MHYHLKHYHSGVHGTLTALRERFFIPFLRRVVTSALRKCVTCKRASGHAYRYPDMPPLPKERVKRSRPFQHIGLDYLGPLPCKNAYSTSDKVWICLITCMATRAVHLEVVFDNTTQEFLLAFRRFLARRGTPDVVYSDNATTFHAAEDTIKAVIFATRSWTSIADYCSKHKIAWRFITPLSPWKGGFYERLVALFKSAFRKAIGRSILTLPQLQTVVAEIEAVLNSRPITPFRAGDSSTQVLKPVDFISPEVDLQLPPIPATAGDFSDISHRLAPWYKESLRVLDSFWDLWHSEYLGALRDRQRKRLRQPRFSNTAPQVGDIVLVADDKVARGQWPFGLIINVHYGKDKCARSADVRMPNGKLLTRSLPHLYPLEVRAVTIFKTPQPQSRPAVVLRQQPPRTAKTAHKFISPH